MTKFYLKRYQDIHATSGTGVVAEGVIFDHGHCCMTWNSPIITVTYFKSIKDVERLHSHEGKTVVVLEGRKRQAKLFQACKDELHIARLAAKHLKTSRKSSNNSK